MLEVFAMVVNNMFDNGIQYSGSNPDKACVQGPTEDKAERLSLERVKNLNMRRGT